MVISEEEEKKEGHLHTSLGLAAAAAERPFFLSSAFLRCAQSHKNFFLSCLKFEKKGKKKIGFAFPPTAELAAAPSWAGKEDEKSVQRAN